jgi:hypothetical protein
MQHHSITKQQNSLDIHWAMGIAAAFTAYIKKNKQTIDYKHSPFNTKIQIDLQFHVNQI